MAGPAHPDAPGLQPLPGVRSADDRPGRRSRRSPAAPARAPRGLPPHVQGDLRRRDAARVRVHLRRDTHRGASLDRARHGRSGRVLPRGHAATRRLLDLPDRGPALGSARDRDRAASAQARARDHRQLRREHHRDVPPARPPPRRLGRRHEHRQDADASPEQGGAARVHAPREEGRPAARGGLRGRGAPAAGDQHRHALPDPDIGRARLDPGGVRRLEPRGARGALPPPLPAALRVLRLLRQRGLRGDRGAARVGPSRRAGGLRDLRDWSPRREGVR